MFSFRLHIQGILLDSFMNVLQLFKNKLHMTFGSPSFL
jgi:hypothetical protein